MASSDSNPTLYLGWSSQHWRVVALAFAISGLVAGILAIVFYGLLPEQGTWDRYPESLDGLCEQFCESSHRCHLTMAERPPIFQPADAWSGFAFLIFGLLPILNRFDLSTIAFLIGNAYLGFGSFMFHASLAEVWGNVDVAGIIAVVGATACHGLHSVFGISWRWMFLPIFILTLCTNFFYATIRSIGLTVDIQMYTLIGIMSFCTLRLVVARINKMPSTTSTTRDAKTSPSSSRTPKWLASLKLILYASFPGILFLSAFGIWLLENARAFCNPNSILQGHAVWHVLSAISLFMNWQFVDQNRLADILESKPEVFEETDRTLEFGEDEDDDDIVVSCEVKLDLPSQHSLRQKADMEMGLTSDSSLDGSEASFADGAANLNDDFSV